MDWLKSITGGSTKGTESTTAKNAPNPMPTNMKKTNLKGKGDLAQEGIEVLSKTEEAIENFTDPFDVENRKPLFSFLGFSDLSIWDLLLGFASGLFARDVRLEWHDCLGGPLMMFKGMMKLAVEFFSQDFTNIFGVITNFVIL